jgi:hypothetical protein
MIAAAQKRSENIIEYVLYMWHIEDVLRSLNLSMDEVRAKLLPAYQTDADTIKIIEQWYSLIIKEMRENNLLEKGHLEELNELIRELDFLHTSLLHLYRDENYIKAFEIAKEDLQDLDRKTAAKGNSIVNTGLTALYGVLVLKLKGKALFDETKTAMEHIGNLFAILAHRYKAMKEGRLELTGSHKN